MTIFVTLYLFFLTGFLLNGLFNDPWRRETQFIVDGVTNKRVFWHLMGKDGFAVPTVFLLYVTNVERKEFTSSLGYASGADERLYDHHISKTVIRKRRHALQNVSKLNQEIEKREKEIVSLLTDQQFPSLYATFVKASEELKDDIYLFGVPSEYEWMSEVFSKLCKLTGTGHEQWQKRKQLSEQLPDYEWDSTGERRRSNFDEFEAAYVECGAVYRKAVCESFQGDSGTLSNLLQEWEQLNMLRWCLIDFTAWTSGKNRLQTTFWRLIVNIFL